jgi:hypothetical protein
MIKSNIIEIGMIKKNKLLNKTANSNNTKIEILVNTTLKAWL